jgi:hypothetical protein
MAIGFLRYWIRPTRVALFRRTGWARDAMAAAVLALGAGHLVAIAEIARWDGRVGPRVVVAGGIVAALVALAFTSRRVREAVHPLSWGFVRRGAYGVFVVALVQTAVAGPGFLEAALRWLYFATGIAVAGNGVARVVVGRHREEVVETEGHPLPNALGEEIGGAPRPVDLLRYLRDALRAARDDGEQVSIYVVDLASASAIETSVQPAVERIRARARRRDFIAIDGASLILVRRAKYAARDTQVVSDQLRALARPPAHDGHTPARVGVASFPNDGWEPGLLVRSAVNAMQGARPEGGIAHAEGVISRAVA